jgi:dTDP-glucose 4,6-dehydratase
MKVLITGGAGFVGSALVRHMLATSDWDVVNLDKLTYACNPETLTVFAENARHKFVRGDICDAEKVRGLIAGEEPDAILHLAAETHVDRSIDAPAAFVQTNIIGTHVLLENALSYWRSLPRARREAFRFLHVSTDEVYGSLGTHGAFDENSPHRPNSPYAASKAASDHLVRAWHMTYGLPTLTVHASNNYGPYQFPEKLIPLMIMRALSGETLPVYGKGENVRSWLHVEDHARALTEVLRKGRPGESYDVGSDCEMKNIDLVRMLCGLLDETQPAGPARPHERLITFVPDRPGHDLRYAVSSAKIRNETGWAPRETMESGLRKTLRWYLDNRSWWEALREGYRGERLGLIRES